MYEQVLVEYVQKGDYTVQQAIIAAKSIMFDNSNRLYKLGQTAEDTPQESREGQIALSNRSNSSILEAFLNDNPELEFIWAVFYEYTATNRVRMFPLREFRKLVKGERRAGIAMAVFNMLQNDSVAPPDPLIAGQFYLRPDLSTLSINVGLVSNSATVMTFWETEDGKPQEGCPRSTLRNMVTKCETEFNLKLLCGFEVEVVFMEKSDSRDTDCNDDQSSDCAGDQTVYKPWVSNHSWSNMTSDTRRAFPLIEDVVRELAQLDIHIEMFHAESSPSQFEFVLPPAPPLEAVDVLLKTRQTIVHLAEQLELRATLYPRPYATSAGTAAHVHISINPPTKEESFLAGMLHHLPAILPFTFPQDASYERVKEGIWAGGVWVAWGVQNRETPVRKIGPGHWEVKSIDGLANPYLGVAAILAGGYLGIKSDMKLEMKNCTGELYP